MVITAVATSARLISVALNGARAPVRGARSHTSNSSVPFCAAANRTRLALSAGGAPLPARSVATQAQVSPYVAAHSDAIGRVSPLTYHTAAQPACRPFPRPTLPRCVIRRALLQTRRLREPRPRRPAPWLPRQRKWRFWRLADSGASRFVSYMASGFPVAILAAVVSRCPEKDMSKKAFNRVYLFLYPANH